MISISYSKSYFNIFDVTSRVTTVNTADFDYRRSSEKHDVRASAFAF